MTNKILIIACSLFLIACGDSGTTSKNSVNQQGARILGMDVNETPSVTFDAAYSASVSMGVRETSISLDWESLEPTVGIYVDTIPDIIDFFYPAQTGDLTLIIRPLDTTGARYPADLSGNFDDPDVLATFDNFLIYLHSRFTALNASGKLKWIQVGNEIDADLGADPVKWAQWITFFNVAKSRIKALWPEVEVSSVIQFGALQNQSILDQYLILLPSLDIAALTYYPLNSDFTTRATNTVVTDFDFMVSSIPDKKLFLQECGYPSSSVNLSSEMQQADFISKVFKAWDKHIDRIKIIDFSWQFDISEDQANQFVMDYGLSGALHENEFKHYLSSLGLSNHDASEKLALQQLRDELLLRDWNQ